jgi:hypothetical protein
MQNNLRGMYVEAMVAELLGCGWKPSGGDWSGWDIQHEGGVRVEVKQSAKQQTWGEARTAPRFDIKVAAGHYPDGVTYVVNHSGKRLAHYYIFAWHDGSDQRSPSEWNFYVVNSNDLPEGQKSIGLTQLRKLTKSVSWIELQSKIEVQELSLNKSN